MFIQFVCFSFHQLFHCQRARCLQTNQVTAVALYTIEKDTLPWLHTRESSLRESFPHLNSMRIIRYVNCYLSNCINSFTAIRLGRKQKLPPHRIPTVGIVQKVPSQHNNPQTSPTWRSHLPLLWCGIDGSAQSNTCNLFQRGWPRALLQGFMQINKLSV